MGAGGHARPGKGAFSCSLPETEIGAGRWGSHPVTEPAPAEVQALPKGASKPVEQLLARDVGALRLGGLARMSAVIERGAGMDVGKTFVGVGGMSGPREQAPRGETCTVGATTAELEGWQQWWGEERGTPVVMESTGCYGKPAFNLLEAMRERHSTQADPSTERCPRGSAEEGPASAEDWLQPGTSGMFRRAVAATG
jgi:hypothetical protein